MTRAAAFKQIDITRALKGAKEAGVKVTRVEIDPQGKIIMLMDEKPANDPNEWDEIHEEA